VKLRRMRPAEHIARIGDMGNAFNNLIVRHEKKTPIGTSVLKMEGK
jgi:hypothetical protein